jgi:hypothetical protein
MRVSTGLLTRLSLATIPAIFAIATSAMAGDEVFSPTAAISMPASGKIISFDISYVDPVIGLYILGDRTNSAVDVIDTTTNTVLTQLHGGFAGATGNNATSGPNGVLIVKHREAWAGDAPCPTGALGCAPITTTSHVKVIDLFSQAVTHVIDTGGSFRADEMCWDPRDQLVMVANNADTPPFASIISTKTYTVLKKITFDGSNGAPNSNNGIEQCVWDHRTGKFYVTVPGITPAVGPTIPNQGGVAVIDPGSMSVVNTINIPVANCDTPQGMAVGPDRQLLVGCNGSTSTTQSSVVIDDRNGNIIATVANESGPDEVWFNPGDDHYFLARSSAVGTNQLLGVIDADNPGPVDVQRDSDAITANKSIAGRNAHSVAADPIMNQVYVPIPAGVSTICGSLGGVDANGCIAVFTTPHDDHSEDDDDHHHDHDHDRH